MMPSSSTPPSTSSNTPNGGHPSSPPTTPPTTNVPMKKKQGAYGKIPTHSDSTFFQLLHVNEVIAAWKLLYWTPLKCNLDELLFLDGNEDEGEAAAAGGEDAKKKKVKMEDLSFCNTILTSVSRSFAAVIRQLPSIVLVDVMIFYLVLRALDTIEDDMTFFHKAMMMMGEGDDATDSSEDITTTTAINNNNNNHANQAKVTALLSFHKTALTNPNWKLMGCGDGDERRLLEHFPQCHSIFLSLPTESRRIIMDITQRMACGMAEFVTKDLGQGTSDILEYNRYCHFVAGLVGEGLSRLFVSSGLESPSLACELHLSDQMGLFLQKTNIIRDYLEDYVDGRAFWPMEIWNKYSPNGDLGYFANPTTEEAKNAGLACLDELITDALELVPDCLTYLSKLQCMEIFRFCAIPQVMAIATLEKCYHNPNVFTGVVKIRKGTSCLLINSAVDLRGVHDIFHRFAMRIMSKAEGLQRHQQQEQTKKKCSGGKSGGGDLVSYDRTIEACRTILELTRVEDEKASSSSSTTAAALVVASCVAGAAAVMAAQGGGGPSKNMLTASTTTTTTTVTAVAASAAAVALSFGSYFVGGKKKSKRMLSEEQGDDDGNCSSLSKMQLLPAVKIMEQKKKRQQQL